MNRLKWYQATTNILTSLDIDEQAKASVLFELLLTELENQEEAQHPETAEYLYEDFTLLRLLNKECLS